MIGGEEDEGKTITSISAVCVGARGMHQKVGRSRDHDCYTDDRSSNNSARDGEERGWNDSHEQREPPAVQ